jgi:2-keto-4-pentenoate hydratase/2-oxohepta-3-ene-1,7-dioic acid hydratase in catechol pathway
LPAARELHSRYFTLKPGDITFTGTPEGVISGYPKEKQVWLKAGDVVTTSIGVEDFNCLG